MDIGLVVVADEKVDDLALRRLQVAIAQDTRFMWLLGPTSWIDDEAVSRIDAIREVEASSKVYRQRRAPVKEDVYQAQHRPSCRASGSLWCVCKREEG